jgi:hypothetical protein
MFLNFAVRFPSLNFANTSSLAYLSLSHNQPEGMLSLSSFSKCIQLKNLGLSSSSTNFQVRAETLANMSMQLQVIELSNCNLNVNSGVLHSLLSRQHGLQTIDLSNNNLNDHFPTWLIENNIYLSYLNVQNNSLVGTLVLPSKVNNHLVWLDASCNMLNDNIPEDISTKLPNLHPSHRSSRNDGSRNDEPGTGTTFLMPFLPCRIDFVPSFPPRTNDPGTRNAASFPFRGD